MHFNSQSQALAAPKIHPLWVLFLFVFHRFCIILQPLVTSDIGLYHSLTSLSVTDPHFVIYRSHDFAYPFLPWLLIQWPIKIPGSLDINQYATSLRCLFFLIEFAFLLGVYYWFWRKKEDVRKITWPLAIYVILTSFVYTLIYDRVDLLMMISLVLIFATWSAPKTRFLSLSFMLGFLIKLIPLGLWPFKFLELWPKSKHQALQSILMPIWALIPLLLAEKFFFPGQIASLSIHSQRGIQIESLWATPFLLIQSFNPHAAYNIDTYFAAQEITGAAIPAWYFGLARYLGFAVLALIFWFFYRQRKTLEHPLQRTQLFLVFIFSFLAFQRVLSPQFFIWATPFLAIYWLYDRNWKFWTGILAMYCLTYVCFVVGYWDIINFSKFYVSLLAIRNTLVLFFFAFFTQQFFRTKSLS